jgi:aldehyde dehydrogenase (NAD+)
MAPPSFSHEFTTGPFKGKSEFSTGLFINGQFVDGVEGKTIE